MQPDFWLERWRRNEIGFHQPLFNTHLQEYWQQLRLPPGGRVFVPLCGKSRDLLWLRAQGHSVVGVEISAIALRDFFSENNLTPQLGHRPPFDHSQVEGIDLLCGDFFELTQSDLAGVTGVYDRAALIALPPPLRERYVAKLVEILPPPVEILLVTMEYPQDQMQGPPFSVTEEEVRALYTAHYHIESLHSKDILGDNPRFRERGLTHLQERVYRLHPHAR